MDNDKFLVLIDLLEKESAARLSAESSKALEIESMRQIIASMQVSFNQIIEDLNLTITDLNATIGTLLEQNRLLSAPKKNSGNSSIPPSKDENRPLKKTNSLRNPSGKKPGAQKGHNGSTLLMSTTPDVIEDHEPQFCNCCGLGLGAFQGELLNRRQVIDIPAVIPSFTEHRIFAKSCSCGHTTRASFPSGVNAPISYGPNAHAQVAYLHTRQYMPVARIAEHFSTLYNMPISQGTVCNMLERFANKALPAYKLIKTKVMEASVVGADETGMKINGDKNWFWTWQCKLATYIVAATNRAYQTVIDHFPLGFPNAILVHDCWSSHLKTTAQGHQLCIAHLLRELNYFKEKYNCTWTSKVFQLFMQALELKKILRPEQYDNPIKERSEIEAILNELCMQVIEPVYPDVITFQKRILKYRDHMLTFLYQYDVPADNNASEQAIRNVKVKQKISGMFKSFTGANIYAIIRSIIDTCIKNNQNILNTFITIAKN
ncbi:IS66 family transposase [Sphingobacterium sp. JB170]|uniref:IS66 family transposase n=2 Tax=unclassified Sphingobacterium TaxID=2609468 RepID=UPI00038A4E11|nr:IS66 family transposase [Sphingobacterium sp. JB170]KKX46977.1 hypothetical protein L950_0228985 [Sphingobacterium sp. IITKGP-BTPF85]SJN49004.1 Transposase [Sphingobacterium sp. JB170]